MKERQDGSQPSGLAYIGSDTHNKGKRGLYSIERGRVGPFNLRGRQQGTKGRKHMHVALLYRKTKRTAIEFERKARPELEEGNVLIAASLAYRKRFVYTALSIQQN